MTYQDVLTMQECKIGDITAHSLTAAHAYKVAKFKAELRRLSECYQNMRNQLPREAGVEDPQAFDTRMTELDKKAQEGKLTKAEQNEYDELNPKRVRFAELLNNLLDEEPQHDIKAMPYEEWKALQDENRNVICEVTDNNGQKKQLELLMVVEPILMNILWAEPTD